MTTASLRRNANPAQAFFLDASPGKRFCLYYPPHSSQNCKGAFIYVHPFAEEMNNSRRVAASQARAFSAMGYAVLQIDLYGCGDSSGDFSDARWEIWKQDLTAAYEWLAQQISAPISLWGLRLGALLALDFAQNPSHPINSILLWQPILKGQTYFKQFLRLQLAGGLLRGQSNGSQDTQSLRIKLAAGEALEIAGYTIASPLANAIDNIDANLLPQPNCDIHWLEITSQANKSLSPQVHNLASKWQESMHKFSLQQVECPAFWLGHSEFDYADLIASTNAIITHE